MTDTNALVYGPEITTEGHCGNCPACKSERYRVQSDSGHNVYYAHPSMSEEPNKRRLIGDTTWRTPKWCPAQRCVDDTAENGVLRERVKELEGIADAYRNTQDEHLNLIANLRQQVAELEYTCEKRSLAFDMCSRNRQKKVDEIKRLRAENEALTWLVSKELVAHRMIDTGLWMIVDGAGYPAIDGSEHETALAAIDAARVARGEG